MRRAAEPMEAQSRLRATRTLLGAVLERTLAGPALDTVELVRTSEGTRVSTPPPARDEPAPESATTDAPRVRGGIAGAALDAAVAAAAADARRFRAKNASRPVSSGSARERAASFEASSSADG